MANKRKPRLKPAGPWLDMDGVAKRLRRAVKGNASAWAKAHDISPAYVSDVLQGRRLPGKKITKALGLEKALLWRTPHGWYSPSDGGR
jgi:hypothetical protein